MRDVACELVTVTRGMSTDWKRVKQVLAEAAARDAPAERAERQALALMDHPNIARVLDAGATDTGRPYFVMELVRGIKITDYCDQNHLSTEERLNLFVQVCHALQHAHQKGVIHRDVKPSNILVTLQDGKPMPKVIDFGIAKATDQRLTDKTLFTAFELFIGTPAYMSPEQAQMSTLDIDTRSDIYALGVLLYELLTGDTPFDQKQHELAKPQQSDRRGARAREHEARPPARLSWPPRLQNSPEQKTKTTTLYTNLFTKPRPMPVKRWVYSFACPPTRALRSRSLLRGRRSVWHCMPKATQRRRYASCATW